MPEVYIYIEYTKNIQRVYQQYNIYITRVYIHTKYRSAANMCFHVTSVYTWYILCIYKVYTRHILVYATDIACTSCCFQSFTALIAHQHRCLMAQRTTRKKHIMMLILISLIRKQYWRDSDGYDEQGRFASAQFGEVPLPWICLSYTMHMFSI